MVTQNHFAFECSNGFRRRFWVLVLELEFSRQSYQMMGRWENVCSGHVSSLIGHDKMFLQV